MLKQSRGGMVISVVIGIIILAAAVVGIGKHFDFNFPMLEGSKTNLKDTRDEQCGVVKYSLEKNWQEASSSDSKKTCLYTNDNPNNNHTAVFDIIVSDLGNNPLYNTKSYQKEYLEKTKDLIAGEIQQNQQFSHEYTEFFNVPVLRITLTIDQGEKGVLMHRNTIFIKNNNFFMISLMDEKDTFYEKWPKIENTIKNMTFTK